MDVREWFNEYNRDLEQRVERESTGRILAHLFEHRLARPLTPEERDRLAQRLREDGADRLSDMVLDLAPDALAAWLATTNGR